MKRNSTLLYNNKNQIKWFWYIAFFLIGFIAVILGHIIFTKYNSAKQISLNSINKGDSYFIGNYEQDGNQKNGKEPIEWIVLKKDDEGVLLISRYILDARAYNDNKVDITWEASSLRKWLNEDFYDCAFDEREKNRIVLTQHDNPNSYDFYNTEYTLERFGENTVGKGNGADGGEGTVDKVFLLSWYDALKYFDEDIYRQAEATNYAKESGLYHVALENYKNDGWDESIIGNGIWWLRSPGSSSTDALSVYYDGRIHNNPVDVTYEGIRPVIWVSNSIR